MKKGSTKMAGSKFEHIAIRDLKPWARNARTYSKKQVRQIADSIETFGFTNPVLIDERRTILAGMAGWRAQCCSAWAKFHACGWTT